MERMIIERFDFEQLTLKSGESKCESSIPTLTFYISIMDFETEAINSTVTWYHQAALRSVYVVCTVICCTGSKKSHLPSLGSIQG
jgi:hypothetical protein